MELEERRAVSNVEKYVNFFKDHIEWFAVAAWLGLMIWMAVTL